MKLFHTSTQVTGQGRAQTENKRELNILRRVINDMFRYKNANNTKTMCY